MCKLKWSKLGKSNSSFANPLFEGGLPYRRATQATQEPSALIARGSGPLSCGSQLALQGRAGKPLTWFKTRGFQQGEKHIPSSIDSFDLLSAPTDRTYREITNALQVKYPFSARSHTRAHRSRESGLHTLLSRNTKLRLFRFCRRRSGSSGSALHYSGTVQSSFQSDCPRWTPSSASSSF